MNVEINIIHTNMAKRLGAPVLGQWGEVII